MATIENATVAKFKTLFNKGIPYLPIYDNTQTYILGDIVYSNGFYESLKNNNTSALTDTTAWESIVDSVSNYISDDDITRAFAEAKINFNPDLFETDADAEMIFYYLAAHYLVIDNNNALNGLAYGYQGLTSSKHVGSVSESYSIPTWMMNDPIYSLYANTGYGLKYLSLIAPYLVGNIIFVQGKINL